MRSICTLNVLLSYPFILLFWRAVCSNHTFCFQMWDICGGGIRNRAGVFAIGGQYCHCYTSNQYNLYSLVACSTHTHTHVHLCTCTTCFMWSNSYVSIHVTRGLWTAKIHSRPLSVIILGCHLEALRMPSHVKNLIPLSCDYCPTPIYPFSLYTLTGVFVKS